MTATSRKITVSIVVLVAMVGVAISTSSRPAAAVEGGTPADLSSAVYICYTHGVIQRILNKCVNCTGSLISDQWVLTAGHCVNTVDDVGESPDAVPKSGLSVFVDALGPHQQMFDVSDIQFYPAVKTGICGTPAVDLALIKLAKPITLSSALTPLALVPPRPLGTTGGTLPVTSPATLPVISPAPVDYGYGATGGVVDAIGNCNITLKNREPDNGLNQTRPGDYSTSVCPHANDLCLIHSAPHTVDGKSYSMPGDSGSPWVIPPSTKIPGGGTTKNPLEFGVESQGTDCVVDQVCPDDTAVDLANPAIHSWIATTAGIVSVPTGTIVDLPGGTSWYVESDGFAHEIPNTKTDNCLVGQGASRYWMVPYQFHEVPQASAPATCSAGSSGPSGWPQSHYGPDRNGYQPNETQIGPGNVGKLSEARTYEGGTAPLIANGVLYVATNKFYAYDASGASNCAAAPTGCTPLWTAPAAYFDGMAVADGDVFVTDQEGVQAYDANGSKNCSGTPKVCAPLWATSVNEATGPGFSPGGGSPVVADGTLYVPGYGDGGAPSTGGAYVAAFDPEGLNGCKVYKDFGTICVPMWTTIGIPTSRGNAGSPAVVNGKIYIANGSLYVFDASGCSPTPTGCPPIWTTPAVTGGTYSAPAVAYGTVYVGAANGPLYAYDAAGSRKCKGSGQTKSCSPLWTAVTGGTGGTPAVANGVVYTVSGGGTLSAFDAAGSSTHCSSTVTAKTCTPLWTSASGGTGYVTSSSPAVANGVVYFSSTNGGTYGYSASGSLNCSVFGGAKTCAPLWGATTGFIGGGSPTVADGVLYINFPFIGETYAYSL